MVLGLREKVYQAQIDSVKLFVPTVLLLGDGGYEFSVLGNTAAAAVASGRRRSVQGNAPERKQSRQNVRKDKGKNMGHGVATLTRVHVSDDLGKVAAKLGILVA